ncbi:MAG: hypothetical protein AAGB24_07535 [Bacteroidota bacterium]
MKSIIATVIFLCTGISLQAQVDRTNFRAGVNAGAVVGDFSDGYSFSIGLDLVYHWGISKAFDVGLATGFTNAFGESGTFSGNVVGFDTELEGDLVNIETEFEDAQFLPVAASVRYYPTYHFKFGGDVGYAIGINDGNEGGIYYRPVVGYNITGNTELHVSYTAIEDDSTFETLVLGVLFLF